MYNSIAFQDTVFLDLKSEAENPNDNEISSASKNNENIRDLYSSNEAPTKVISGGNFQHKRFIHKQKLSQFALKTRIK